MGVFAAVGTAGVPGAGLIMTTIVFTQVGIPLEAVALIAGIDRILDMIRTSINVVGDVASALVVTNLEGDLNKEPYQEGEANPAVCASAEALCGRTAQWRNGPGLHFGARDLLF